jgi:kinesin family protein 3/17
MEPLEDMPNKQPSNEDAYEASALQDLFQQQATPVGKKLSFSSACPPTTGGNVTGTINRSRARGENVEVFLRIKPLLGAEEGQVPTMTVVDANSILVAAPSTSQAALSSRDEDDSRHMETEKADTKFTFSEVFKADSAQVEVFDAAMSPLVENLLHGKHSLLFAYGITNAGKTHTIMGNKDHPGLLPLALHRVFEGVEASGSKSEMEVKVSYLEIYNENVYDLMAIPDKRRGREILKLADRNGKVEVKGLKSHPVRDVDQALKIIHTGTKNRQVAETQLNTDSSRSHSVFAIHLINHLTGKSSRLYVVDLAGSERGKRTGATGGRLKESSMINTSLMHLMHCIETLRWNQQHPSAVPRLVPFRQTKLTRLFQELLVGEGSGRTVMIVNASAAAADYDETLTTLRYGALAREICKSKSTAGSRGTMLMAAAAKYAANGRRIASARARVTSSQTVSGKSSEHDSNGRRCEAGEAAADDEEDELEDLESAHTMMMLQTENRCLREALVQTEQQCIDLETDIREEVAAEMQDRLQEMESNFKLRQSSENEERQQQLQLQSLLVMKRRVEDGDGGTISVEDIEELVDQVKECEQEMSRMRGRHDQELAALRSTQGEDECDETTVSNLTIENESLRVELSDTKAELSSVVAEAEQFQVMLTTANVDSERRVELDAQLLQLEQHLKEEKEGAAIRDAAADAAADTLLAKLRGEEKKHTIQQQTMEQTLQQNSELKTEVVMLQKRLTEVLSHRKSHERYETEETNFSTVEENEVASDETKDETKDAVQTTANESTVAANAPSPPRRRSRRASNVTNNPPAVDKVATADALPVPVSDDVTPNKSVAAKKSKMGKRGKKFLKKMVLGYKRKETAEDVDAENPSALAPVKNHGNTRGTLMTETASEKSKQSSTPRTSLTADDVENMQSEMSTYLSQQLATQQSAVGGPTPIARRLRSRSRTSRTGAF